MNIKFRILFTVTLSHTYYRDGLCKDFDFIIPADTQQWLNNGRLLAKVREGKLYVLFEVGEDNQPLVSIAGQTLRFGLKLNNPFFGNFTRLDINLAKVDINPAQAFLYKNTTTDLLQSEKIQVISLPKELQRPSVFGMIEITLDNERFYKEPLDFKITFEAKEEPLKYYVIAKNDIEIKKITVSDQGGSGITFTSTPIDDKLLGQGLLFESNKVKRQELARKKIQLSKNGEVLIEHLPQPSASKTTADFIIQLSKP